ncbi:MAG: c-type cytochrome [Acidobacteria bacterium]|nr:c-type cytochrome [Acidobacteriota bacterium]
MRTLFTFVCASALLAQTGESIYLTQCSICHGQRGEGGRGAILAKPKLLHAPDDRALQRVIRRGISGTGMPGTGLADSEIELVAAYVRSLGRVRQAPLPGNPERGRAIYNGRAGCAACHMIDARGGSHGPELTTVGAIRGGDYLRESLVNPEADITRGYVFVRAVTRDKRVVTGTRVNADTFTIQLRDPAGVVHSFIKSELAELNIDLRKSTMPSYRGKLSAEELDDLVAWLATLQGAQ